VPVSALLRAVLRALAKRFADELQGLDPNDRLDVYARRAELYLVMLRRLPETFEVIGGAVHGWLDQHGAAASLRARVLQVLELDEAFCPRVGPSHQITRRFRFAADRVDHFLGRMELPPETAFGLSSTTLDIHHPAHVGEVLMNPDGGSWMRGQIKQSHGEVAMTVVV
jgi:hypothetical protein